MKTTKKIYKTPETEVTHVEIESSICGGSVEFGKDKDNPKAIVAEDQEISTGFTSANNFSGQEWDMSKGSANNP